MSKYPDILRCFAFFPRKTAFLKIHFTYLVLIPASTILQQYDSLGAKNSYHPGPPVHIFSYLSRQNNKIVTLVHKVVGLSKSCCYVISTLGNLKNYFCIKEIRLKTFFWSLQAFYLILNDALFKERAYIYCKILKGTMHRGEICQFSVQLLHFQYLQ